MLRREVAALLLRGDFRDPALRNPAAISVTGASVSSDLSTARVFVDVLGETRVRTEVLRALNAAAGVFRTHVGKIARMRRVPTLRFETDESIARGLAIERVLGELARERVEPVAPAADDGASADAAAPAEEPNSASPLSSDALDEAEDP